MTIPKIIRKVLKAEGRTQAWAVEEMNKIDPKLNIDRVKFSAIVCGSRRMTGDELLAFCKALQVSPDVFLEKKVG